MLSSELSDTERRIRDAMATGRVVDVRHDDAFEPVDDDAKTVRAAVLARLLISADHTVVALRLRGAKVTGHLNLGGRRITIPVEFRDCEFVGRVQLAKSRFPELSFRGSYFPHGISGRGLRVNGALNLTDCRFDNRLYLKRLGAEIVFADGVVVHGSGEFAIQLRGAMIKQELYCRNSYATRGCVTLYGAKISGQLLLDNTRIDNPGDALVAPNLDVGQDLRLRRVQITGRVDLAKARVGGDVAMNHAQLYSPNAQALRFDMVHIGQNVFLHDDFEADGEVSMFLARISGRLELDGAVLRNRRGNALDASRVEVGQSMTLSRADCDGAVKMYGASVGGNLALDGVTVLNPGSVALEASQCRVGQSMWLDQDARLDGEVNMSNTRIVDRLRLCNVRMNRMCANELSVSILDDDPDCWPQHSQIGGMRYVRLPEDNRGAPRLRIAWLKRLLPRYSPQPYTQLMSAYQRAGSTTAQRMVVMAKEDMRRRDHRSPWRRAFSVVWSMVLRWTIGYGHAPWRAFAWAGALFIAAWAVFATAPVTAYGSRTLFSGEFQPALYALDTLLPVLRVSGGSEWYMRGGYAWWEAGFAASGWFLSIVVAAGVGGVFKRD